MLDDYTVSIKVKDQETGQFVYQSMPLERYCRNIKKGLTGALINVENFFALQAGTPDKRLWAEKDLEDFNEIRKSLLNAANNIERLPYSTKHKNVPICGKSMTEMINDFANKLSEHKNK